jgi:hypothetical protein
MGAAIFYVGDSPDHSPDTSLEGGGDSAVQTVTPEPTSWPAGGQCNGHGGGQCNGHSGGQCNGHGGGQHGPADHEEEETIKRRLKFFFMNPREKYEARGALPWKLLLQAVKLVLVTSQLACFANIRFAHVNYVSGQTIALQHLFIKVGCITYLNIQYSIG